MPRKITPINIKTFNNSKMIQYHLEDTYLNGILELQKELEIHTWPLNCVE